MVRRDLDKIPTARLKEATSGGLRLTAIEAAGFRTVLAVLDAGVRRLQAIDGVGDKTAMQAHAAAQQVATAVDDDLKFRIDLDPDDSLGTRVVVALHRWARLHHATAGLDEDLQRAAAELAGLRDTAVPARGWVALFTGGRTGATVGAPAVNDWIAWADARDAWSRLRSAESVMEERRPSAKDAWADFAKRSAEYYALLGLLVDLKTDDAANQGYLPEDIVARVHAQPLDATFATVSLRGYQSFGARFALAQERVIIGDEMGLGKTIQAIAALAHLKAAGSQHFLVVCPASVLINWMREIRQHSKLLPYQLHGFERIANERRWLRRGDVAVTTFDSLRHLNLPADLDLAMLVVDEAHYAKNPHAQRSQRVADMAARAERVLFLTGTPMENRVEEFASLVERLHPAVMPTVEGRRAIAGPGAFRRSVAPVYLRRNQEDVLSELPDLVQVDEWEEFGKADLIAYRRAVAEGNFMAMRRAAFSSGDPITSPKVQRLLEIADEAGANGHKVIVFSYFREVLSTVHRALGSRAFGPLTGDVSPPKRQALIDDFTRADGHGVLVSQIQAGGVGLNMQAASVVILCEPQVKPTMEAQAIARAHRMGQLRTVQVHRLLTQDSVDQRMLEILDSKARLFDEYARRSDIAESSPEAVDISEVALAREVVALEQERLATAAMEELNAEGER
ncbi:ATP-dependent helicase [Blastococcus sp. TBT05-19]|nr:ATP-dependent helicase [Blastococcus sp. TBT05-19]